MKLSCSPRCIWFAAIVLLTLLATPSDTLRAQQTLGIAAVVNEEVISLYDLESRINLLISTSRQKITKENRKQYTSQVLNQLINEKLQLQEAEHLGVKVSEKELEREFNRVARDSKMTPKQLVQYLGNINVEKETLINQLHARIAWGRTVNRLFRSELSIGREEVDEIIGEMKRSKGKPEYLVADIFLPVDTPENAEKQRQTALSIISQIKSGARFSVMARNFSQSATAAVGGDLGWVRQGQLAAELDTAIAAMKDGSLSQPVKTISGFHILLKRKSRVGQGLTSEGEQVDLYQVFLPLPPSASDTDVKVGLDAAAKATAGATGCDAMAKIGAQSGSKLSGRLGKVKLSSLPMETRKSVESLDIGKPSRPIHSGNGIIVLVVCERTGKISVSEIRDKIENTLLNERLDILARRHLRDLRRTAFLDIRL